MSVGAENKDEEDVSGFVEALGRILIAGNRLALLFDVSALLLLLLLLLSLMLLLLI